MSCRPVQALKEEVDEGCASRRLPVRGAAARRLVWRPSARRCHRVQRPTLPTSQPSLNGYALRGGMRHARTHAASKGYPAEVTESEADRFARTDGADVRPSRVGYERSDHCGTVSGPCRRLRSPSRGGLESCHQLGLEAGTQAQIARLDRPSDEAGQWAASVPVGASGSTRRRDRL